MGAKRYSTEQIIVRLREADISLGIVPRNQAARRVSPRISIWYKNASPLGDSILRSSFSMV